MIKVNQTRFGGFNSPLEEQGNCFQACVATVLQIPLEEAFDCVLNEADNWFERFNDWLSQYGLGCIFIWHNKDKPAKTTSFKGIHIADCESANLYNGERHAVVIRDGDLLHDPNPHASRQGDVQGVYMFVPLEAYRLVRMKVI